MKKKFFALMLAALGAVASAQNPQSQTAPTFAVNAKYTNGVAPGYAPTAGAGLVLNVGPGTANCSGTIVTYAGGTLTMTASATNYVYLNTAASCAPAVKTTAFTSTDIPVAVVVTGSSLISSISDDRTPFNVPGNSSGLACLSGDVSAGSGTCTNVILATVNSAPGTCGDSTHVCQVTTNAKGLTTGQTAVAISAGGGGCSGSTANGVCYNNAGTGQYATDVKVDVGGTPNIQIGAPSSAAQAAMPSGAHGSALDESGTAGVPAAGVDYIRGDSVNHCIEASFNGGAESCLLNGTSTGLYSTTLSVPTITSLGMSTSFNQSGTFSITNNAAGVSLYDSTSTGGTNHMEGVLMAYPSVAFTATGLFSVPPIGVNFLEVGITAAANTSCSGGTACLMSWNILYSGAWEGYVAGYTALNSNPASTIKTCASSIASYIWLRWQDTGTTLNFSESGDGQNWQVCYTVAKSSSYLNGNFNFIGVYISPEGAAMGTNVLSWKVTTP